MIKMHIQINSLILYRQILMNVILPYTPNKGMYFSKLIFAMHPAMEGGDFFFDKLGLAYLADTYSVAIIAPSLGNGYFINSPYEKQADFLQAELMPVLREMLPLSSRREDNMLLGISMGAFGAAHWALRCPETFGAAALISGVFDASLPIDERARKNREQRPLVKLFSEKVMPLLMRDEEGNISSEADIRPLYARAAEKGAPDFALWCGEGDYLSLEQSRNFARNCRAQGISVTEHIAPGAHNLAFWEGAVGDALHWLIGKGK